MRNTTHKLRSPQAAPLDVLTAVRQLRRDAFTLVEMLVSTALVLLMLVMFAQIFGTSVKTMREQQSLAQNDQKARSVETVLRNDFNKSTFRQPRVKGVTGLVPLSANWPVDAERQRGYWHIEINDPDNPADDIIQFTIDLRQTSRDPEIGVLRGRGKGLLQTPGMTPGGLAQNDDNQPDWDDGFFGNDIGESHAAEVTYFLRGGNLYRRVLLLREPPRPTMTALLPPSEFSVQPGLTHTGAYLDTSTGTVYNRKFLRGGVPGDYDASLDPAGTGQPAFWNDFDYSAWNWWRDLNADGSMDTAGTDQYWLMFSGADSLQNAPGAVEFPIALPQYRFGHRPISNDATMAGQPMDYLLSAPTLAGSPVGFLGRFTHEETSNAAFGYPGIVPQDSAGVALNPFYRAYVAAWDGDANSVVDDYQNGPRAGEDIILSNVESFEIDVWDDGINEVDANGNGTFDVATEDLNGNGVLDRPQFVKIGHAAVSGVAPLGYFSQANLLNPFYGGRNAGTGTDGVPGSAGDDDGNGTPDDATELGWPGSDDIINRVFDTWHPNAAVGPADPFGLGPTATRFQNFLPPLAPTKMSLFPPVSSGFTRTAWGRRMLATPQTIIFPGVEDKNCNGVADGSEDVQVTNSALDPAEDLNGNGMLDPGEDRNASGALDPAEDRFSFYYDGAGGYAVVSDINGNPTSNGVLDPAEDRNQNGAVIGPLDSDTSYYYRPIRATEDLNNDGTLQTGEDLNGNGTIDAIAVTGLKEPEWPREPGATVNDGTVVWQCFDNRVGLQMIRLTIRYKDVGSGLPRQVSLIHSFVE